MTRLEKLNTTIENRPEYQGGTMSLLSKAKREEQRQRDRQRREQQILLNQSHSYISNISHPQNAVKIPKIPTSSSNSPRPASPDYDPRNTPWNKNRLPKNTRPVDNGDHGTYYSAPTVPRPKKLTTRLSKTKKD